jgi:hypothetical protein
MIGGIILRRFLVISIPIILLTICVLIMLSGSFFKKPRGDWDDVIKHIDTTTEAIMSDDWILAEENSNKLDTAWTAVTKRIQFSCERDEIHALGVSIARLKAAITAKDKTSALLELSEAEEHWDDLGK